MFFLKICKIKDLIVQNGHTIIFLYNSHNIFINLYTFDNETICVAFCEHNPAEKIVKSFKEIDYNQKNSFKGVPVEIGDNGRPVFSDDIPVRLKIGDKEIPKLSKMPQHLQDFHKHVEKELIFYIKKSVDFLRWRLNNPGPNNYLTNISFEWTLDLNEWYPMLMDIVAVPKPEIVPIKIEIDETYNINLLKEFDGEPLGHQIFREAWYLQTLNPRSSLIMAIAAAEIGFKQFVINLDGSTEWLILNIPSPSLIKMLNEYLIRLPVKAKIKGRIVVPPQELLNELRDGINIRNTLIHTGKSSADRKKLINILNAVKDLLLIFDFYSGYEWSLDYLTPEIKELMIS